MAVFRGISLSFAVVAAVIGFIALFSSPAVTTTWWFGDQGEPWNEWISECSGVGFDMTCRYIVPGDHYLDYLCDYASFFQSQPEDWDDCNYISR